MITLRPPKRCGTILPAILCLIGSLAASNRPAESQVDHRDSVLSRGEPCPLEPGTYVIRDSTTGEFKGILIVYPDCRLEVVT